MVREFSYAGGMFGLAASSLPQPPPPGQPGQSGQNQPPGFGYGGQPPQGYGGPPQGGPPYAGPPNGPQPSGGGQPKWAVGLSIVLVIALIGSVGFNVVQAQRTSDLSDRVAALQSEASQLAEENQQLADENTQLEQELADGGDGEGLPDDDDLLPDGGGDDDLGGLLDGLLGDDEGDGGGLLDGLFGDGDDDGGLLDGLFGGDGDLGDLGDLFGGGGLDELGGSDLDMGLMMQCLGDAPEPGSLDVPDTSAGDQIEAIAEHVEQLRGLEFESDPPYTFLGPDEFGDEVRERFEEDLDATDAEFESRILSSLGVVEPGTDLAEMFLDLISSQAAGFYDTEDGDIYVVAEDPEAPMGPVTQSTMAHELEHALADQHLDLAVDDEDADLDASTAYLAVVEGDATLTQQLWTAGAFSMSEQLELAQDPLVAESQEGIDTFPHYMAAELMFSYERGLEFACSQHIEGGWDAINAAYAEPPVSTAEILFPERYGDAPAEPAPLGEPGGSWQSELADTYGAAQLSWLFEAPGDNEEAALEDPQGAAAGWDGGIFELWTDGDDTGFGMSFAQRDGERDLCDSLTEWYSGAFPDASDAGAEGDEVLAVEGDQQSASIVCGDGAQVGIGPDLDTARAISGG